ncbi:ligand-binding sensor domain-containing protein [Hyunsoonleella aestuarii]|uniref:Diguanylate cyclase n=1 Tax=Hyunsoonleella aestuarii TaxID=912802 RepID=A0ABP8E7I4_9FLAO|nr:two-component regulator propeller domain-containing protein [Hyunsoonleella aestuarii]
MSLKIIEFKVILIFGILSIILSCSGQTKTKNFNTPEKTIALGKTVSKIEKKILIIFQDSKNNLWFGGNDNGVYKYDDKSLVLYTEKDKLIENNVWGIQEDRFGNIYFDTAEGVSKFDGQQFTTLNVVENSSFKNEWKLEPNDLWFRMGWNNSGPYRFDGENLYHLQFPKNIIEDKFYSINPNVSYNPYGVYHIYKDSKGNMWFGTSNLGVYKYDGNNIRWMFEKHLTETPDGGSFGIRSIIEDKDGFIWICNPKYKFKILPDNTKTNDLKQINYQREFGIEIKNLKSLYFMSMTIDNKGDLWMVTYDNGVWRKNENELIHYPIKDGDTEVLLFSIYNDNQGTLWLGTHNAGVYKFNGESFEKFEL